METAGWPTLFFYLTLGSVVLLSMANGMYQVSMLINMIIKMTRIIKITKMTNIIKMAWLQNTVYGLAARLPFRYTGAVVLGSVNIFALVVVFVLCCWYSLWIGGYLAFVAKKKGVLWLSKLLPPLLITNCRLEGNQLSPHDPRWWLDPKKLRMVFSTKRAKRAKHGSKWAKLGWEWTKKKLLAKTFTD